MCESCGKAYEAYVAKMREKTWTGNCCRIKIIAVVVFRDHLRTEKESVV